MPVSARAGPVSAARRATGVGPRASRTMPVVPGAAPWKHGPRDARRVPPMRGEFAGIDGECTGRRRDGQLPLA
ncbi:hypothetical protein Y601_3858 [Burkholderia pseudomallei MSHR640]|nr:hypothetical protein Y601_3858 [Burkholderia pseudomallei MSHR640]